MSKTTKNQSILRWFESEKLKDSKEVENVKKKYIQEIKGLKKEEIFKEPKKLTLWQKLKILLLGN
jgi:hypothetical protein